MTQAKLVANFESIAVALHDEAPSEKARAFVDKIASAIRAKGAEWIAANEFALHITFSAEEQEDLTPVEDNRLWYIAEWQIALAK
jgi:predicted pyridoxine 5'-phosphate oxidase superfamily flavin-nucleotide-binding protein